MGKIKTLIATLTLSAAILAYAPAIPATEYSPSIAGLGPVVNSTVIDGTPIRVHKLNNAMIMEIMDKETGLAKIYGIILIHPVSQDDADAFVADLFGNSDLSDSESHSAADDKGHSMTLVTNEFNTFTSVYTLLGESKLVSRITIIPKNI